MTDLCRLYHSQSTDKTQQQEDMRTDAFDLIAHFFGGSKPSAAHIPRLHAGEWYFYSFHNYTIYCNCMQIECSALSRVVLKTSRLQNNCNSESVEKTKLQPWCFIHFKAGQSAYARQSGNVLSLNKQHLELVSEAKLTQNKKLKKNRKYRIHGLTKEKIPVLVRVTCLSIIADF